MDIQVISLLGSVGSCGASLVVMYFSLQYIRERDKDNKDNVSRVEAIGEKFAKSLDDAVDKFDLALKGMHKENREITTALFSLQKDTISVVSTIKAEMVSAMASLKGEVASLRDEVRSGHQGGKA